MPQPYVGEIRLFAFPRTPDGWLACDGSLQSIGSFDLLYAVIGLTFGGDGNTTFGLPDLRGRVPISQGSGNNLTPRSMGQLFGEQNHTLMNQEMPAHSHALNSTTNVGTTATPSQSVHLASSNNGNIYAPQADVTAYIGMAPAVVAVGQSQPHSNMMPTLTANFCICFEGVFPNAS